VDETRWGSLTQHPDQFDKYYYATVGELRNPASVPMRILSQHCANPHK
jgi:hypothetical protein